MKGDRCPICRKKAVETLAYYHRVLLGRKELVDVHVYRCRAGHIWLHGYLFFLGQPFDEVKLVGYKLPYRVRVRYGEWSKTLRLRKAFFLRAIKKGLALETVFNSPVYTIVVMDVKGQEMVFLPSKPKLKVYVDDWLECPNHKAIVAVALFSGKLRLHAEFLYEEGAVICV